LGIERKTIIGWLNHKEYQDHRGWQKNKVRKYGDKSIAEKICFLKQQRVNKKKYFVGSHYVQMDFEKKYPKKEAPKIWYIDKVVRDAKLQTKIPKPKRKKGGSEYLLYPVKCVKQLGYVQQSADFIGRKYISGRSEPINIFSSSYYFPFKLYRIARILAEKAVYAIGDIEKQWRKYPIPNVFRMDNGLQWRGTASGKRAIGTMLKFLLNLSVIPLFGSPSKPWTNPHIEGHNRVFNDKVWNSNFFTSPGQIDRECERFNKESLEFYEYKYSQLVFNGNFRYLGTKQRITTDRLETIKGKKVYFIRFVESRERGRKSMIIILNEIIYLPEKYNHQFVFVEWDIEKERLLIYSEYKQEITLIYQTKFRLNI
jgi:hypothetical protein